MWVADGPPSANVMTALDGLYGISPRSFSDSVWDDVEDFGVVLIYPDPLMRSAAVVRSLLDRLRLTTAVGLLLVEADQQEAFLGDDEQTHRFVVMSPDSPPGEIACALRTLAAIQPGLAQLRGRADEAESSQSEYSGRIVQMEEEMRLAARLQRDFLPKQLPQIAPVNFSVLFRPVGWVSGDIYEAARLDESHIGFYVADAVGHGMPAALLTMFIKRALPTKRIIGDHYEIVEPAEAMRELNAAICEQQLSSCQFCSAFYAILDINTQELTYSRGGHPEPILQRRSGRVETLSVGGGLLGVFPESDFQQTTLTLKRGDRLMLFSDGAEAVFRSDHSCGRDEFVAELLGCAAMDCDLAALQLTGVLDDRIGGREQEDDITVLIMDVSP